MAAEPPGGVPTQEDEIGELLSWGVFLRVVPSQLGFKPLSRVQDTLELARLLAPFALAPNLNADPLT
jgi:hypothetical protein